MKRRWIMCSLATLCVGATAIAIAQQPPRPRLHTITQRGVLKPLPATSTPAIKNEVSIEVVGDERIIRANGIPNHRTGAFPNRGNPNRITAQRHEYRVPANPKIADRITPMHGEFGVAINGVPFDPGAGEFYDGEPGWQYEPLSGAIALGIDVSHAHVQPTGKYHYHGLPTGLIDSVKVEAGQHSPLIGWAADGFPIYAVYGYSDPKNSDSDVVKLTSSYQLKKGSRPGGNAPDGKYDGTFVRDYEHVEGSGDLDECNGRFTITPEYSDGTYAYFMTEAWPVVPRCYRGTPSEDFRHGPNPGSLGPGSMHPGNSGAGGFGSRERGFGGRGDDRFASGPGDRDGRIRGESRGGFDGPMPGIGGPPNGTPGGEGMHPGPPLPGVVLPAFVRQFLNLTAAQSRELEQLQTHVDQRLESILTKDQQRLLHQNAPPGGHPMGPAGSNGNLRRPDFRGR
ncbi:hypothetical protein FHS27_003961 [Rhodopirellula rubra]|uniref:YHYH domain-containing protein n=1 Tax=Aporhodopirellula rubra TaxID=980271 RepID=A0A7W5H766_9BACT|nr:YHYH protein [Aporhodopirellula rubra]MBB3208134.1 hypothetical protein [Aporhodopirellula rubra]